MWHKDAMQWNGNPAVKGNPWYNWNGLGQGQGQTGTYTGGKLTGGEVSDPNAGNYQQMTSAPVLPSYLGLPFRILVSPFVYFDPETRCTDIMMFNSKNLGALIVAEEPHVKSWEDGQYNIQNMAIEETFAAESCMKGRTFAVAETAKVRPSEIDMQARTVFTPGIHIHPAGLPPLPSAAAGALASVFAGAYLPSPAALGRVAQRGIWRAGRFQAIQVPSSAEIAPSRRRKCGNLPGVGGAEIGCFTEGRAVCGNLAE